MPALELAQETGKVLHWLKAPGDTVRKGEPLVEIETDKVTTEIEAPASGVLARRDRAGRRRRPGRTDRSRCIAAPDEARAPRVRARRSRPRGAAARRPPSCTGRRRRPADRSRPRRSPAKIAEQHGVDLAQVRTGRRQDREGRRARLRREPEAAPTRRRRDGRAPRRAASPKARRLAAERGRRHPRAPRLGPRRRRARGRRPSRRRLPRRSPRTPAARPPRRPGVGTVWRIMAERMTASWTTAPHFYLFREVNVEPAGRLAASGRASRPAPASPTPTSW